MANQIWALEPAREIIKRLGGVEHVAALTGKHRSRVFRWMYPENKGGTGGLIPQRLIPKLLDYARANGIKLDANDFLPSNNGRQHGKEKRHGGTRNRRERQRVQADSRS